MELTYNSTYKSAYSIAITIVLWFWLLSNSYNELSNCTKKLLIFNVIINIDNEILFYIVSNLFVSCWLIYF